jgi:hypothetical protein
MPIRESVEAERLKSLAISALSTFMHTRAAHRSTMRTELASSQLAWLVYTSGTIVACPSGEEEQQVVAEIGRRLSDVRFEF